MSNYFSLKNPNTIAIFVYILLFLGYFVGIRFDNVYVDKVIGLLLYLFPIYIFVLILNTKTEKKLLKTILAILVALISLGSLLFIVFAVPDIYFTATNGGVDPAFEKINTLDVGSSVVAVYRTNGGATTDFAIIVRSERAILPGVYIEHQLVNIYDADNIDLTVVPPDSIKINTIDFTSPQYQAEYMSNNPQFTDGEILNLN